MTERRSIRANVATAFAGSISRGAIRFVTTLLIARSLGPGGRGEFAFVTNTVAFLVLLAGAGIPTALTRARVAWRTEASDLYGASVVVSLLTGGVAIAAFACTWFLAPTLYRNVDDEAAKWIAVLVIPSLVLSHWTVISYLDDRVREFTVAIVVGILLFLASITALLAVGRLDVRTTIASWAVTSLVPVFMVLRSTYLWRIPRSTRLAMRLLRYGARVNVASLSAILVWRIDVFIIKGARGLAELGLYAVAVAIGEIMLQVAAAFRIALTPRQGESDDRATLVESIYRVSRIAFASAVVFALALVAVSGPLVRVLYGDAFVRAAPALAILLPGVVMLMLQGPLMDYLLTEGRVRGVTLWTAGSLGLNVTLNLWWLQTHSFVYAALASTLAYFVSSLGVAHIFCRTTGRPWRQLLVPTRDDVRTIVGMARFRRARTV